MAARSVRDAEVAGSNPAVPTRKHQFRAALRGGLLVGGWFKSRVIKRVVLKFGSGRTAPRCVIALLDDETVAAVDWR